MGQNVVKAILFDLDGVIVDTAKYHFLAWKKLADEIGEPFDEQINERFKGVGRADCFKILVENSAKHYTDEEAEVLMTRKNDYYIDFLELIKPESIYDGVLDFIKQARKKGLRLAVCSASKNAMTVLEKLDVLEYLDVVVTGKDVRNSKPDPEVFTQAANKLNVAYDRCVVVEDSAAGICAANRCGMLSIGINVNPNDARASVNVRTPSDLVFDKLFADGKLVTGE